MAPAAVSRTVVVVSLRWLSEQTSTAMGIANEAATALNAGLGRDGAGTLDLPPRWRLVAATPFDREPAAIVLERRLRWGRAPALFLVTFQGDEGWLSPSPATETSLRDIREVPDATQLAGLIVDGRSSVLLCARLPDGARGADLVDARGRVVGRDDATSRYVLAYPDSDDLDGATWRVTGGPDHGVREQPLVLDVGPGHRRSWWEIIRRRATTRRSG